MTTWRYIATDPTGQQHAFARTGAYTVRVAGCDYPNIRAAYLALRLRGWRVVTEETDR